MLYLELDGRERRLRWASAGHVPGIVAEGGHGERLGEPGGPPLGVTDPETWLSDERVLAPGARVVVFTDGLIERRTEPLDVGIERDRRDRRAARPTSRRCARRRSPTRPSRGSTTWR